MQIPKDLLHALRRRFLTDFYWATRFVLGYEFLDAPFHKQLCDFVTGADKAREKYSLTLAPRGHGKSFIVGASLPVWCLCRYPERKFGIIQDSNDLSGDLMGVPKAHFDNNLLLRALFPDIVWENTRDAPIWKTNAITLRRKSFDQTPSLMAMSEKSSKTGKHFDWLLCDDLVNKGNVNNPEQLLGVRKFLQTLPPLLMGPKSKILINGTRWDYEDAYGWLLNAPEIKNAVRSLVLSPFNPDGSVIWPSKHTIQTLEDERVAMGDYLFSANYMNNPSPIGKHIFHAERIQRWIADPDEKGRLLPPNTSEGPRRLSYFTVVDPNAGQEQQHDLGVVMTVGRDWEGAHWVVDVMAGHPSVEEMVAWIRDQVKKWNPDALLVETIAYQKQLSHWLRMDAQRHGLVYPIRELGSAERNKSHKYTRIRALDPLINMNKLWIPYGEKFEPIVTQIATYSSTAANDDYLDCLADAWQYGTNPSAPRAVKTPPNPNSMAYYSKSFFEELHGRQMGQIKRYR